MATDLARLGFTPWFRNQALVAGGVPARVFAVHRTGLEVRGENVDALLPLGGRWFQEDAEARPTVGDWVMLDAPCETIETVLERASLLKRMHPGRPNEVQLIAANVDLLLIVTSCNEEFNAGRLERYLALAEEAGLASVVVLTKADLCDDAEPFVQAARTLRRGVEVVAVDATDAESVAVLAPWCQPGSTVALVGSSGVGKSTILNALAGGELQRTGEIREDDGKGRHTTTHRSLHLLDSGLLVVDSPGIRELGLVEAALQDVFDDVENLAAACRFGDCAHESEPGCAVRAAIATGELDARRLDSYRKLQREDLINRESVAERHARVRRFSKNVKAAMQSRQNRNKET